MDDNFAERLRQLRSLVPPLKPQQAARPGDRQGARAPAECHLALRATKSTSIRVDGSCIVIAAEGSFNCGGKDRKTKREARHVQLLDFARLHRAARRAPAKARPSTSATASSPTTSRPKSPAGRWVASMHELETVMRVPEAPSDFDTLHDLSLRPEHQQAGSGLPHRVSYN
jgi:hypothetical protein